MERKGQQSPPPRETTAMTKIETLAATLAATSKGTWEQAADMDIADRWTGETVRTVSSKPVWVANPAYAALESELRAAKAEAAANERNASAAADKAAVMAARQAVALTKWDRTLKSPLGTIELTVREGEISVYVNLKNGKSGSGTFSLETLEVRRSSYLTGEPRNVAEEIGQAIKASMA
jgi:hypothetical protein